MTRSMVAGWFVELLIRRSGVPRPDLVAKWTDHPIHESSKVLASPMARSMPIALLTVSLYS